MDEHREEKNGDAEDYGQQIEKKLEDFDEKKKEEITKAIDEIFNQAYEEDVKKRKAEEEL